MAGNIAQCVAFIFQCCIHIILLYCVLCNNYVYLLWKIGTSVNGCQLQTTILTQERLPLSPRSGQSTGPVSCQNVVALRKSVQGLGSARFLLKPRRLGNARSSLTCNWSSLQVKVLKICHWGNSNFISIPYRTIKCVYNFFRNLMVRNW